jgi:ABC-type multidrug transport system ATPase subunit
MDLCWICGYLLGNEPACAATPKEQWTRMTALQVTDATKIYGTKKRRFVAVNQSSFECGGGEVVGIVGPNGAGKTTLLRMIAGETAITSGEAYVCGLCVGTRAARRVVGYVGDPPLLPGELTGIEWLKYVCGHRSSHPRGRNGKLQWAIDLADLGDFVGCNICEYSSGMMQKMGLATAAVLGSDVLVLDEVLSGIDPLVARGLRGAIAKLATTGRLLVIASHDLSALERLATRVLVMFEGSLVSDVSIAKLASERVAELSLSGSALDHRHTLFDRFADAVGTEDGVSIPLTRGVTIEEAMAVCRTERIPVAASRIRYRALEDILAAAATRSSGRECDSEHGERRSRR